MKRVMYVVLILSFVALSVSASVGFLSLPDEDFVVKGDVESFLREQRRWAVMNAHDFKMRVGKLTPVKSMPHFGGDRGEGGEDFARAHDAVIPTMRVSSPKKTTTASAVSTQDVASDSVNALDAVQDPNLAPFYEWGQRAHPDIMHELTFEIVNPRKAMLEERLRTHPDDNVVRSELARNIIYSPSKNFRGEAAVKAFIEEIGAHIVRENLVLITAIAPVSLWEQALRTKFYDLSTNVGVRSYLHRAKAYSLPKSVAIHVDAVHGIADVPVYSENDPRKLSGSRHGEIVLPMELFAHPPIRRQAARRRSVDADLDNEA
jgi:hypothetical protein